MLALSVSSNARPDQFDEFIHTLAVDIQDRREAFLEGWADSA